MLISTRETHEEKDCMNKTTPSPDYTQINGDWVLAWDKLPGLSLTPQDRRNIIDKYAKKYVRWVLEGVDRSISHTYDPPWDHSGSIFSQPLPAETLRGQYQTLGEWMKEALTGQQTPTFILH